MDSRELKEEYERIIGKFRNAIFRANDLSVIRDVLTEDFIDHFAPDYDPEGRQGVSNRFMQAQEAFETEQLEVLTSVFEEPILSQSVKIHFRHVGRFMNIAPTGRRFWIGGANTFVFRNGRIAEHFGVFDVAKIPDLLSNKGSGGWRDMWSS